MSTGRCTASRSCNSPRACQSLEPMGRVGRSALPRTDSETASRTQSQDPRKPSVRLLNSALTGLRTSSSAENAPSASPPESASDNQGEDNQKEADSPRDSETSEAPTLTDEGEQAPTDVAENVAQPAVEKSQIKVRIPVHEYPGYNFIGRLLGPRGATLKHLENDTSCRLFIRGRGSLRASDPTLEAQKARLPGFEHLNEDLHLLIEHSGPLEHRPAAMASAERQENASSCPTSEKRPLAST